MEKRIQNARKDLSKVINKNSVGEIGEGYCLFPLSKEEAQKPRTNIDPNSQYYFIGNTKYIVWRGELRQIICKKVWSRIKKEIIESFSQQEVIELQKLQITGSQQDNLIPVELEKQLILIGNQNPGFSKPYQNKSCFDEQYNNPMKRSASELTYTAHRNSTEERAPKIAKPNISPYDSGLTLFPTSQISNNNAYDFFDNPDFLFNPEDQYTDFFSSSDVFN